MAEEKLVELSFDILDHITNKRITDGKVQLFIFDNNGNKKNIQNIKLTNTDKPSTVKVDIQYVRQRVYIELESSGYRSTPFPNPYVSTIILLFMRHGLVQKVRFVPKDFYIGIVKAYGKRLCLNSKQSDYLLNWRNETISLAKDQEITLKAYLMYDKDNIRNFIEASDYEESISNQVHWAFTIVDNIAGFSSSDGSDSLRRDIDDYGNGEYLYPTTPKKSIENKLPIEKLIEINKHLNRNSLQQFKIYKLMKSGKDITGHIINFKLSDVLSEELLNDSNFLDRFCIIFFAYTLEDKPHYYKDPDNVQSIELKMVANKYSMVFDGYNLELYKNGKYVESYNARLTENGNLRKREEFKYKQKDGIDDLYKCEAKLRSKVVDNMLRRVLYLKPDSDNNDLISNFIVDNVMLSNLENQLKPKKDNDNQSNTQNNITSKVIHISSIDFIKLWHKIQFQSDILVKFIYQPNYVIEVTRYKEVYNNKTISHMLGRYGATYGVFAVYVYYMGEKFLLDSVIDAYNSEQKDNEGEVIDKDNIISTHIETINIFVNNPKNHDSIKTDMYKKDLQNKANYGTLIYGGYTMEPAGPDCITSNLKRRIPEGHYKGIYHYSDARYRCNTMNLYSDMLRYKRNILVHAGGQHISFTTGCILVSAESYETGNNYSREDLNGNEDYDTSTMKILKRLDNLYKTLYDHNIDKKLKFNKDISSCISLAIRNQINRG